MQLCHTTSIAGESTPFPLPPELKTGDADNECLGMPQHPDPRGWEEITEDEDLTQEDTIRACPDCYGQSFSSSSSILLLLEGLKCGSMKADAIPIG